MQTKPIRLEPAASIIQTLGGVERVSEITDRHISRVYRWMYPKDRGGTGGIIPQPEAAKMLAYAKDKRIRLSPAAFFGTPAPVPAEAAL